MRKPRFLLPTALAGLAAVAATAQAQSPAPRWSSNTDYSTPGARDLPVTCRRGDVQPFEGKTMGEVFGGAWPQAPAATASHTPPKVISSGKVIPPRGLEGKPATVVVAVLVGADGKPLAAEAVCMSDGAFAIAAKRVLRNASFEPATIDGKPVTSVLAVPISFRPIRRGGGSGGDSGSGGGSQE
ncbi:energy transducer TonB [Thermomonas sp. S9]|uniref:energy transducer TonB n=1 Tax=Thermomonas sp. S9 TaxID=2885203 RepID=UPI00216AE7A8|nr:energy transducer TonB [Thermomonas sp. S9]MCR6494864.1 energy transducer TonB [Thermomonas sp. S9]